MGGAIVRGMVATAPQEAVNITVIDLSSNIREDFELLGVHTAEVDQNAVMESDLVIVAVKPWLIDEVMNQYKQALALSNAAVASIAAGVTLDMLSELTDRPLLRIMPNTAVSVSESMTFIASKGTSEEQRREVSRIFSLLGQVMEVPESRMDACMALASCGIAYAMRYVRAATEGGVELGIPPHIAQKIINQTIRGAAALLEIEGAHPESEIDKVTTPGGITIRGLNAMERCGFSNAVIEGLKASK